MSRQCSCAQLFYMLCNWTKHSSADAADRAQHDTVEFDHDAIPVQSQIPSQSDPAHVGSPDMHSETVEESTLETSVDSKMPRGNSEGVGTVGNAGVNHTDGPRKQEDVTSTLPKPELVARPQAPVIIDTPVGVGMDKETRLKLRKEARDKAREEAIRQENPSRSAPLIRPPVSVTICVADEESNANIKLPEVPLQMQYSGLQPVISSSRASVSCTSLGIDELLRQLNDELRTTYTIHTPSLREHLEECISKGHDFGMAYALLRPRWFDDFSKLRSISDVCQKEDEKRRRDALDTSRGRITARVQPRRVWDLFANRVVPNWVIRKEPWAVSHSWMEESLRRSVKTPINAFEWPVPIPIDSTLERVRIELLNLQAEYVWLDVLCLRQVGDDEREALRKQEWLIDVPTIGGIYHQNQMIVCYYSGLGRPFRIGNLSHPRHWLNRAWTLQEISLNTFTAGKTEDADCPSRASVREEDGHYDDKNTDEFFHRIASLSRFSQDVDSIFDPLASMRGRSAVNELDKIAGLAYLLRAENVPVYVEGRSAEDAWDNLLRTMHYRYLGDLLFRYPYPGASHHTWAPSWEQVKDPTRELPAPGGNSLFEKVQIVTDIQSKSAGAPEENPSMELRNIVHHRGYRVMECRIERLENGAAGSKLHRIGSAVIGDHRFEVHAYHGQAIVKEKPLTMVAGEGLEYWVVGLVEHSGLIKKQSVVKMMKEDRERLKQLKLGSMQDSEYL